MVTEELPVYMQEVAALHSLRVLRDWMLRRGGQQAGPLRPDIYPGDFKTTFTLKNWFHTGALELRSAEATPLVEDIKRFPTWLQGGFRSPRCHMPEDQVPDNAAWRRRSSGVWYCRKEEHSGPMNYHGSH